MDVTAAGSLARRLLRPLTAVCVAFVVTGVVLASLRLLAQERDRLDEKASDLVNAIGVIGEHAATQDELQRMLSALGARRAVRLVVVVAGQDPRVVAGSRFAWMGKRLAELPDPEVAAALALALETRAGAGAWHGEGGYRHTRPVRFTLDEVTHLTPTLGAVLVEIDAEPSRARVLAGIALLALASALATALLVRVLRGLVRQHVLGPLDSVERQLRSEQPGPRMIHVGPEWADQLRVLVEALNGALDEARRRELELRDSEARTREMLDALPHQVWTATPDGRIDHVSAQMLAYCGVGPEALLGAGWAGFLHPDDAPAVLEAWRAALTSGRSTAVEARVRAADGSYRWHLSRWQPLRDLSGKLLRWFGVNVDLTEQKQVEIESARARDAALAVAASRAAFEAVFQRSPDGLLLTDEAGVVHRANARATALFGDLAGARVEDLLEGGGPLLSSVLGVDPGAPAEERLHSLRARGRAGPFAAEVGAASTPDAVPYAAILSVRDLTERQRMEEALTRSLHEKDTLLREVHHRVKNNLQIVSSLLTMQAQNLGDGPAAGALTEAVHRVRSMAFVHRQLYGTDHLARVDLGAYAQTLGQSLVSSLDPAATVAFAVEPVEVAVDTAVPCGLVLNELLTNALKHGRSPDGSCHLRVEVRGDGDGFVLAVGDRGPGFAPRSAAPTSLGMQLIRTLGRQVRGKVEMVNEGGAVVRIRVPFDQPRPPQGPSTAA